MKTRISSLVLLLSAGLTATGAQAAIVASDNAADSVYDSGLTDGLDGGTGTGAWIVTTTGANAASLVGNSRSNGFDDGVAINSPSGPSGRAFGLGASDGDVATATLPLDTALQVGETISFGFDFGFVETGGVAEAALQNADGEDILSISFTGGGNFDVTDGGGATDTGLGFASNGFLVEITLDSATTYTGTIVKLADRTVANISGSLSAPAGGQIIDRVSFSADGLAPTGTGATSTVHFFYFNNIEVDDNTDTPLVVALDEASDVAYDSGFNDGSDGGTGTGAWAIVTGSNSGSFIGDSRANGFSGGAGINTDGESFRLQSSDGDVATATLPFDEAMLVDDTISFGFDFGFVENGGITGATLQNASGEDLVSLTYTGGGALDVNDASGATDTGLGFTSDGFDVTLTLDSATTMSGVVRSLNDGSEAAVSATLLSPAGGQTIEQITFSANNLAPSAGSADPGWHFYFNAIRIERPTPVTSVERWDLFDN